MKHDRAEGRVVRSDMPTVCGECGLSLDLHDGPDSCEGAQLKADAIARADWAVFTAGVIRRPPTAKGVKLW